MPLCISAQRVGTLMCLTRMHTRVNICQAKMTGRDVTYNNPGKLMGGKVCALPQRSLDPYKAMGLTNRVYDICGPS